MTIYGVWRCSTDNQDQERQVIALKKAGATKIYGDFITGKSNFQSRPELTKCLEEMKSGDCLILSELSRLHRNFLGMVNEVANLLEKGIHIKTLDGRFDSTSMPKEITMLLVSILGYAASQEHAQIISRCAEGRAVARMKGNVKFGAKRKYTKEQAKFVCEMREEGRSWNNIAKSMNFTVAKCRRIVELQEVA
mgnify:FL=1